MSTNGSVVGGYQNCSEINMMGNRSSSSILNSSKQCASLNSSINTNSNFHIMNTNNISKNMEHQKTTNANCLRPKSFWFRHLNSLSSIWYGITVTLFNSYLIYIAAKRYIGFTILQNSGKDTYKLCIQSEQLSFVLGLIAVIPFLVTTIFKVGNIANDGLKLGDTLRRCSRKPTDGLAGESNRTAIRAMFLHAGPVSVVIHLTLGWILLFSNLGCECDSLRNGWMNQDQVWFTEIQPFINSMDLMAAQRNLTGSNKINSLYEINEPPKTHLIEKFGPDNDDLYKSHESYEIQSTLSSSTMSSISTTTATPTPPTTTKMVQILTTPSGEFEEDYLPKFDIPRLKLDDVTQRRDQEDTILPTRRQGHRTGGSGGRKNKNRHHESRGRNYEDKYDNGYTSFDEFDEDDFIEPTRNPRRQHKGNKNSRRYPDSERNQKKVIKDSEIHILRPEKPSEVPGTRKQQKETRRMKRNIIEETLNFRVDDRNIQVTFTDDDRTDENNFISAPEKLIGSSVGVENITSIPKKKIYLNGIDGWLQSIVQVYEPTDRNYLKKSLRLEFINFVAALLIYAIRYAAPFWSTTKTYTIILNFQFLFNMVIILLDYFIMGTLFKLYSIKYSYAAQPPMYMLDNQVVPILIMLAMVMLFISTSVFYYYGYSMIEDKIRDRYTIKSKTAVDNWRYFCHYAFLCTYIGSLICKLPIFYDVMLEYKATLSPFLYNYCIINLVYYIGTLMIWISLGLKKRWKIKLDSSYSNTSAQPLLNANQPTDAVETGYEQNDNSMYWPKLQQPNSPKLKVTFNEVPSTSSSHNLVEHDGKRNRGRRASLCLQNASGEPDDGDYATLRGPPPSEYMNITSLNGTCELGDDNISEEGKLLECVRDDSVTYASTRDLEPPLSTLPLPPDEFLESSIASIQLHSTHEATVVPTNCSASVRCESSLINEILTPRSETTERSNSPPDRASSDTSSGVHSGEERDEVVIRPRAPKPAVKPVQPAIQEEPYGRATNMRMSSFNIDAKSSATLPLQKSMIETRNDYSIHCNTMPLPMGCHQQQYKPQIQQNYATANSSRQQLHHSTLPNEIRYSNGDILRRMPHIRQAESPYGVLGLGSGHHTFSKLLHDPLNNVIVSIPEDRDSANYSMISDQDREMYITAGQMINH